MDTLFQPIDIKHGRILIIDDNPAIHDDIKKILNPHADSTVDLQNAETVLFGDFVPSPVQSKFQMDSAYQGEEGLVLVQQACRDNKPYALAIVDIRMPPGWDGIETINQIWSVDPDIQMIICTAYSDYSWDDMVQVLSKTDNLAVLKKPFENVELLQLTHALTQKWHLKRQVNAHLQRMGELIQEKDLTLQAANVQLKSEINERYRTQDALEDSEERFSLAFQAGPLPMAIIKLENHILVDVNVGFLEMTGLTADSVLEKSCFEIPVWPHTGALADLLHQIHEHTSIRDWEYRIKRTDNTFRDTRVSINKFFLNQEPHALLLFQDITDQIRLETQLRQAQKMESLGQLTAGIAHDFNNLLTVIQGHVSMMLKPTEWAPDYTEGLNYVLDAARRASNLTHQMLAFSRQQIIQPVVLDINRVLETLSLMLDRLIGEQIHCHYYYTPDLPYVYADKTSIEQILINLALNARDAMPKGGTLIISTSLVDIDASYRDRVSEAKEGKHVCLSVVDTGHGIDDDILDRIWEPFFTTKDVGKGTGMGLAMVYGLVKQHDGWITVAGKPDQGATFEIYLPVTEKPLLQDTPTIDAVLDTPVPGGMTVLVVEDDEAVRLFTRMTLEHVGLQVFTATNVAEAMQIWADQNREIDLLFADIILPDGKTGIDLAVLLKAEKPDLHILYTTGYNMAGVNMEQVQDYILPKPFTVDDLLQSVQQCLSPSDDEKDIDDS